MIWLLQRFTIFNYIFLLFKIRFINFFKIIEQFFHVVYQYSGDVIQIKESVLIFFEHLNEPYPSLIRALKCGVEIKKLLGDYKAKVNSSTIQAISFSVSLLFGSIQMMIFGR